MPIALIIGLANPGQRYHDTRHNAGSWFVENLLSAHHADLKSENKLLGASAQITLDGHALRLFIPSTYMNESGKAVQAVMQFYKIAADQVLVAYDDLDLPPGVARLKKGGGTGGHNGLRSIVEHIGTPEFHRLRIGIGHPGNSKLVSDYVLHAPALDDKIAITQAIDKATGVLPLVIAGEFEKAMTQLHT
jgi:PTH1 family peptidyl-tRNA hydrolase